MHYLKLIVAFLFLFLLSSATAAEIEKPVLDNSFDYTFIVAGHAYGSRFGENVGLHPPFVDALETDSNIDFIVLTGDVSRSSTEESWSKITDELTDVGLPYYIAIGGHDYYTDYGLQFVKEKYGDTFYRFDIATERFIFLDTIKEESTISQDQITFLKNSFKGNQDTYFIFTHQLLWNNKPKYEKIRANKGSRYHNLGSSNYWSDVHPILESSGKKVYVITGDVGVNYDGIAAFYEPLGDITLLASGMGDLKDENYLKVNITNGKVDLKLVSLRSGEELNLEDYTVEKLSKRNIFDEVKFFFLRIWDFMYSKYLGR